MVESHRDSRLSFRAGGCSEEKDRTRRRDERRDRVNNAELAEMGQEDLRILGGLIASPQRGAHLLTASTNEFTETELLGAPDHGHDQFVVRTCHGKSNVDMLVFTDCIVA